jgi:hypothetical protein
MDREKTIWMTWQQNAQIFTKDVSQASSASWQMANRI